MNIIGKITGIRYKSFFPNSLKHIDLNMFDVNDAPASSLLKSNEHTFAISKWVSPKRTRSYPFERVYNTLLISKKITVIPVVKDEGANGDRDYIQWDTISLMSLLDVFVIFAYYDDAEKKKNKITNQKFNNQYVISKIKEIEQYHSSALHWNLNELNTNFHNIVDIVKTSYLEIQNKTGVQLHNFKGLDNFKVSIGNDVSLFMEFSRDKAKLAQSREYETIQPKESLSSLTKAKVTISNYLGGQYFLTVDEVKITPEVVSLIERKHSSGGNLPTLSDIKDGLLKMILYCNLTDVFVDDFGVKSEAVLSLTSPKIVGSISSSNSNSEIDVFLSKNNYNKKQQGIIKTLIEEARYNNFIVQICYSV